MKTDNSNSPNSFYNKHYKGKYFATQLKIVEEYFYGNTASRYMCAVDTGIPIQNVCRYVDMLFKTDKIKILRNDRCRISGELVEFLTTNSALFPIMPIQYRLFY